jgi:hypothetical protein
VHIWRYDTYIAKLTLNVDPRVIAQAKRYASSRGVSVSSLVESYLKAIGENDRPEGGEPPVLRKLKGVLTTADVADYRRHLAKKYL